MDENTLGALEAFLHDVWEGESEFEELFNIMGYNELNHLVKSAKRAKELDEQPVMKINRNFKVLALACFIGGMNVGFGVAVMILL